ncbi:MAG: hypothetical protein R3E56_17840 [Burkholderiaceae bacterium]
MSSQGGSSVTLNLEIGRRSTDLVLRATGAVDEHFSLQMGLDTLWPPAPPGHGPSAWAIEHAIQVVEDQIATMHHRVPVGAQLRMPGSAVALLRREGTIPVPNHEAISLAMVEQWYQALAARAEGAPSARGTGFDEPSGDALMLILRELMHHLGFDALHIEDEPAGATGGTGVTKTSSA